MPSAASAPCSSIAIFSIFSRFQSSFQELSLAMKRVLEVSSSSTMRSLFARRELPVSVSSTIASTRGPALASVAPQENSTSAFTLCFSSHFLTTPTSSVAMRLPSRSFDRLDRRIVRDGQHPAHRPKTGLRIEKFADLMDLDAGFHDPVVAGQSRVKNAVGHVARHLLRAHEHDLEFVIVAGRKIRPFRGVHADSRALENFNRRFLQAPLGKPQLQFFAFSMHRPLRIIVKCQDYTDLMQPACDRTGTRRRRAGAPPALHEASRPDDFQGRAGQKYFLRLPQILGRVAPFDAPDSRPGGQEDHDAARDCLPGDRRTRRA